ncbi:hypothetical protein [Aeoliella sp. SH292]|uniref:hypothetical protein n=1 Tax=Aeoliella sp. SH292 TaxID=3454464 RepID=UPI003F9E1505
MPAVRLLLVVLLIVAASHVAAEDTGDSRPSIMGNVVGADGQPLAGVRVDVTIAAPKIGRGIFCPSCYLDCGKVGTTDDQGNFVIPEVDPMLKFQLMCTLPGHEASQTQLIDPDEGPVAITLTPLPDDIDPARLVTGIVTHNGSPIAGALVDPHGAKTADKHWWGRIDGVTSTVSDAEGHFAMQLPEDFLGIHLQVRADGYCGEQLDLVPPGGDPITIEMRTGASVTGRLTHEGQPVAGMSIAVAQLDRGVSDDIFIAAVGDVTDDDGRFEFHYLPPDQRYCIYSLAGDAKRTESPYVLTTKTFTAPATDQSRDLGELEVAEPRSIRGRVVRVDGEPLPENLRLSFGREPAWDLVSAKVADDGSFEMQGLPPETYEIRVGDRNLVVAAKEVRYQMLSDSSFGIRVRESLDDLVVPVQAKGESK